MSRRRNTTTRQVETVCTCGKPTHDGAFVCDGCLDELAVDLRDLVPSTSARPDAVSTVKVWDGVTWCPWPRPVESLPGLWDELVSTVIGERGIDYRTLGAGGSSSGERGVVATGIALNEVAVSIADDVRRTLRALVVVCMDARLAHTAPAEWSPRSSARVPAMAEWLGWRVDGIAWNSEAADRARAVHRAVEAARWVIVPPAARQQLGPCPVSDCDGHLSAMPDATFAKCYRCRGEVEAQPLRDRMLTELDDRLCTAAEIARLSTYLGLRQNRDTVRRRVNLWGHRERIETRGYITPTVEDENGDEVPVPPLAGPVCAKCDHASCPELLESRGAPLYRFGEVYTRLLAAEPNDTASTNDSKGA